MDLDAEQQAMVQREESKNPFEEPKERPKNDENYVSYVDKCKQAGRIGPKQVKLDTKSAYGDVIFSRTNNLDIEATSRFVSIRANTGVFAGKYYYEV